jgi:hypothetical protein
MIKLGNISIVKNIFKTKRKCGELNNEYSNNIDNNINNIEDNNQTD